jgi:riboflavin kinase/FMN adenylyltransferase
VRTALRSGDLAEAERALGRRYRLRGRVQHGAARGRELGYPTANLELPTDACVPMDGIYAAYAHVESQELGARQAMVYIGPRPMFDNGARFVEVNVLDYAGDLYTLDLEIEFVKFIRADAVFASVDELVAQIARDEAATRATLARSPPEAGEARQ